VLDVGGNIDSSTLFAHTEADDGASSLFEPAPALVENHPAQRAPTWHSGHRLNTDCPKSGDHALFTYYHYSVGMSSFHRRRCRGAAQLEDHHGKPAPRGDAKVDQIGEHASELLDVRLSSVTFEAKLRRLSDVLREQQD